MRKYTEVSWLCGGVEHTARVWKARRGSKEVYLCQIFIAPLDKLYSKEYNASSFTGTQCSTEGTGMKKIPHVDVNFVCNRLYKHTIRLVVQGRRVRCRFRCNCYPHNFFCHGYASFEDLPYGARYAAQPAIALLRKVYSCI